MKYVENMQMCTKNESEIIGNIDTPANIIISCDFEYNGFCLNSYGVNECDFCNNLSEKDAKFLNQN